MMQPNPSVQAHLLGLWAVTRSPSDFPGKFVARKWLIGRRDLTPTVDHHIADTLEGVRHAAARPSPHPAQPER